MIRISNTNVRRCASFLVCFWMACGILIAQLTPTKVSYTVMDLYALRYYPFQIKADTIVQKMFAQYDKIAHTEEQHQKTSIQLVANTAFLDSQIQLVAASNSFFYKRLLLPYLHWLDYGVALDADGREIAFSIGLQQKPQQGEGLYNFLGKKNVHFLIDDLLQESRLFHPAITYHYFLAGEKMIDGQEVYEIAFYPQKLRKNASTGYLYISADDNCHLVKTVYTRSNPFTQKYVGKVLWTQTFEASEGKNAPLKKEAVFTLGDRLLGGLLVNRTTYYTDNIEPLTASEQQTYPLVRAAEQTAAFRNLQTGIQLVMGDRLTIGGHQGVFEWASVSQSISYHKLEGLRLRAGGNTTPQLNPHWLLGGYLAYGTRDQQFKYRGDLAYSFLPKDRDIREFPKRLISLSYVRDLNIPGQDLLDNRRDAFYNSFPFSNTDKLSLQKMLTMSYEHELANRLSFRAGGRYLYDQPVGTVQHDAIRSSEVYLAMRYAPGEIFIQNRNSRLKLHRAGMEWNLRHRMGLKDVLGSDYSYHITDFSVYKRWYFPHNAGYGDTQLSAGKLWNRAPFPLLFIPTGNSNYAFSTDRYNSMRIYEFITDRFVSGQADLQFNWSPIRLLFSRSRIQTTLGIKALYGPLSDKNQPELHPELFSLPSEIHALGQTPYIEMHIGLTRIFNIFRVEWVQGMTYSERGKLLLGFSF